MKVALRKAPSVDSRPDHFLGQISMMFIVVDVMYFCYTGRMYVLQKGMEIDKASPEAKAFLFYMMDLLEKVSAEVVHVQMIYKYKYKYKDINSAPGCQLQVSSALQQCE